MGSVCRLWVDSNLCSLVPSSEYCLVEIAYRVFVLSAAINAFRLYLPMVLKNMDNVGSVPEALNEIQLAFVLSVYGVVTEDS